MEGKTGAIMSRRFTPHPLGLIGPGFRPDYVARHERCQYGIARCKRRIHLSGILPVTAAACHAHDSRSQEAMAALRWTPPFPKESPMLAEVVVAPIAEAQLTEVLPVIHRARLGNNARIVRAARANVPAQLRRAGIPTANAPSRVLESACLLVVHAAARSQLAASIALRHGATSAWIVSPNGFWRAFDEGATEVVPPARPADVVAPPVLASGDMAAVEETGNQPGGA